MKNLFFFLWIGMFTSAIGQPHRDYHWVAEASYLKQGSTYGQVSLHYSYYEEENFLLLAGLAGNFRSENKQLIAIAEAQLSSWIRINEGAGGFVNIPVLMLRPQVNLSPYYIAPEIGLQMLILHIKAGYGFPWGKEDKNYPFATEKFRFSVGVSIPIKGKRSY